MMSVSTREESERRLAEAMRAQAIGAGRPGFVGRTPVVSRSAPTDPIGPTVPVPPPLPTPRAVSAEPEPAPGLWQMLRDTRLALLFALLGGVVLGVALALFSLLAPGVVPGLG